MLEIIVVGRDDRAPENVPRVRAAVGHRGRRPGLLKRRPLYRLNLTLALSPERFEALLMGLKPGLVRRGGVELCRRPESAVREVARDRRSP